MNTMLVPTDFSPAARNAADYAAGLCKALGAKMILLHVYMLPVPVSEIPYVMMPADEIQKASENAVKKEATRLYEQSRIEIEWIVRMGIASDEIRDIEKEKNIEMIVIGMKGGGGELDKLIGSTTIAVIRKSHVAVLIIPAEASFSSFGLAAFATDFSFPINPSCFEPLKSLIRNQHANLMIVNVQQSDKTMTPEQVSCRAKMEDLLTGIPHNYQIIKDSDIEHGLQQFIQSASPGIIAMAAHKHNLIERLFKNHHTKIMVYKTHIPLLVLQDKN